MIKKTFLNIGILFFLVLLNFSFLLAEKEYVWAGVMQLVGTRLKGVQ
jgi:hypothetical protein